VVKFKSSIVKYEKPRTAAKISCVIIGPRYFSVSIPSTKTRIFNK